jgi:hypothetical protein
LDRTETLQWLLHEVEKAEALFENGVLKPELVQPVVKLIGEIWHNANAQYQAAESIWRMKAGERYSAGEPQPPDPPLDSFEAAMRGIWAHCQFGSNAVPDSSDLKQRLELIREAIEHAMADQANPELRYVQQQQRIRDIVRGIFSEGDVLFDTRFKPAAIAFMVEDKNRQRIRLFPGGTAVSELEQMTDETIAEKIRQGT